MSGLNPDGSAVNPLTPVPVSYIETDGATNCILDIAQVVGDAFGIVLGLAGIHESISRRAARSILKELGQETLHGLLATIHDFKAAESIWDKAKIAWQLLQEVMNVAGGIQGIISALASSMPWYDWILTGVTIVAQLIMWFASDGIALIAEIAAEGFAVIQLGEDAIKTIEDCVECFENTGTPTHNDTTSSTTNSSNTPTHDDGGTKTTSSTINSDYSGTHRNTVTNSNDFF